MKSQTAPSAYHPWSISLHLASVFLLVLVACSAVAAVHWRSNVLWQAHFWAGQGLLLLTLLRLLVLSACGTPEPLGADATQKMVARLLHRLFYGLLAFLSVTGTLLQLTLALLGSVWTPLSPLAWTWLRSLHQQSALLLAAVLFGHVLLSLLLHALGIPVLARMRARYGWREHWLATSDACVDPVRGAPATPAVPEAPPR